MYEHVNLQVLFNKYNSVEKMGCLTCLYRQYKPKDAQTFKQIYLSNKEYSRYYNSVILNLKSDAKDYSYTDLANFLDYKLFEETIQGIKKEEKAQEIVKRCGFTIVEPNEKEDVKLGIDFKCYKDNILKCLIQVKPHTFFLGNSNEPLKRDRIAALKKEKKAKETYNVPVVYLIYNKNRQEFIKNGNKYGFKLQNLINNDGTTKN